MNDSIENLPLNLVSSPDFDSDNILSEVNPFYATDLVCHWSLFSFTHPRTRSKQFFLGWRCIKISWLFLEFNEKKIDLNTFHYLTNSDYFIDRNCYGKKNLRNVARKISQLSQLFLPQQYNFSQFATFFFSFKLTDIHARYY